MAADEKFRRRFIRESRAAAAVDDPHIIPVYEAGEAGGVLFIAIRFVSGGDVGSLLRREGPLPAARVVNIISPVASALDAAHAAGLVHRDVKPGNMLLDSRPSLPDHVYLSDFGLSQDRRLARDHPLGTFASARRTTAGLTRSPGSSCDWRCRSVRAGLRLRRRPGAVPGPRGTARCPRPARPWHTTSTLPTGVAVDDAETGQDHHERQHRCAQDRPGPGPGGPGRGRGPGRRRTSAATWAAATAGGVVGSGLIHQALGGDRVRR